MSENITEKINKFYVTTPIYYVTAKPHLGSLYSTLLADVATRYHALKGYKTFFLTGTDEHGQKVAQAAHKAGKEPQEFVDSFIDAYKEMWGKYNIDYTKFIRTTDEYHVKAVQEWLEDLIHKGEIYKSHYEGWYCTPCETFVADKDKLETEEQAQLCTSCNRSTIAVSEESYFFKLSAYQDKLLQFYEENPDFITPKERFKEVINFVKNGLKDLSISRTTVTWGIPFLNDPQHVTYVWADALNNYITGVGYKKNSEEFNFWWPADLHILGKDIVRFHAIYWPAFLMASGLALPRKLLVHGWLKVNEQKMSKSLGNVVDPQLLLDAYGADQVRYYLVRHAAITQDSEFSTQALETAINSELANDLGNLLNRLVVLADKHNIYEVKSPESWGAHELELRDKFWTMLNEYTSEMEDVYFYRALNSLWHFINELNAYFHAQEPWKVVKQDVNRFKEILSATVHGLHASALLLYPVMPEKSQELLKSLGVTLEFKELNMLEELSNNPWNHTFMLNKIPTLFEKYLPTEHPKKDNQNHREKAMQKDQNLTPDANISTSNNIGNSESIVTIDDVIKVELRVGTIKECVEVAKSDKLYKMLVDFGDYGIRQILAGIKQYYKIEDLLNKQGIFVYNLKPRKLMGLESHGMMLLAKEGDNLVMATVASSVSNGTRLS